MSWGFTTADLNTCLHVLEVVCDNPDLLDQPAIRATGLRQLINPSMLSRRSPAPKQDIRIRGAAPIPETAVRGTPAPKYGGGGTTGFTAPKYGGAMASNGAAAYATGPPARLSPATAPPAPKYGTTPFKYGASAVSGGGNGSQYGAPAVNPARAPPPPRPLAPTSAPTPTGPKYGTLSSTAAAGFSTREAPAPPPSAPKSTATPSTAAASDTRSKLLGVSGSEAAKMVNLTSKLRQNRNRELSFSPKSPAEGYEHLF